MLKTFRIVLAIIAFVLAGYGLITGNYDVLPYMMFFMGAMFLVMGISEIKKETKANGLYYYWCFFICLLRFNARFHIKLKGAIAEQ
ncbi:DUF3953 domain-containing protein [Rossellomorea sp. BNER]|uniref:DUF3953 domain-containing protein n=1 Tax=Rossellomorea sp. BNER TaxID=2962031 RepID=UPI003AF30AD3|nr:DUF3953 domain-containing protein [Rossellomorea sp. BNER]